MFSSFSSVKNENNSKTPVPGNDCVHEEEQQLRQTPPDLSAFRRQISIIVLIEETT